jgi:putative IMPACT (imprinted ancient) family translation regulator
VEYTKDDGEVGHPGKVLMELLRSNGLDTHVLVVSRIFGGVKLGIGGVSRAFRSAGEGVIEDWNEG